MTNRNTGKLLPLLAVLLTLGVFSLGQSTSAHEQSPAAPATRSNCRDVKGKLSEVSNANGTTGRITNGGILNGMTQLIFTSGVMATPDPTTVSNTDDFTITTKNGVLATHDVGLFDFGSGLFGAINRIDSNASTGRFAGATGVLFIGGQTTDGGATFQSRIMGEICLARDDHESGDEDDDNDR